MTIYFYDEKIKDHLISISDLNYADEKTKEKEIKFILENSAKFDFDILNQKEIFIIDTFSTFTESLKSLTVRKGFVPFLEHYKKLGKKLYINTDALEIKDSNWADFYCDQLKIPRKLIDDFFGCGMKYFMNFNDSESIKYEVSLWGDDAYPHPEFIQADVSYKLFKKWAYEKKVPLEKAIVIADGRTEMRSSLVSGVDLLVVPYMGMMEKEVPFTFRDLYS